MPVFKVNQLNTKTNTWERARSITAPDFLQAVTTVAKSFNGMRAKRTEDGLVVKEAHARVFIIQDPSAV